MIVYICVCMYVYSQLRLTQTPINSDFLLV